MKGNHPIDEFLGNRKELSSSVFTDESLHLILQGSQGNVRQALSICSYTIDRAVKTGADHVDREIVKSVIG